MKVWLDNISCHQTTDATVIIVGTHRDCVKGSKHVINQYIQHMKGLIDNMICQYSKKNLRIADVVEVSCNVADPYGM